jgi:chromosome segregation ATPase
MVDPAKTGAPPVTLSPEEDRFMRRFVRRHALLGPVGAVAVAALGLGLAALSGGAGRAPETALAEAPGDVAALRRELAELAARLESASGTGAAADAQREQLAALERRIEAVAAELSGLRRRWETTAAVNPGAPPELASMLERLYNLEARADETEAARSSTQRDLLDRVHTLEARQGEREQQDLSAGDGIRERLLAVEAALDAAETHRLSGQDAILDRLLALERRLGGSVPASPAD